MSPAIYCNSQHWRSPHGEAQAETQLKTSGAADHTQSTNSAASLLLMPNPHGRLADVWKTWVQLQGVQPEGRGQAMPDSADRNR